MQPGFALVDEDMAASCLEVIAIELELQYTRFVMGMAYPLLRSMLLLSVYMTHSN